MKILLFIWRCKIHHFNVNLKIQNGWRRPFWILEIWPRSELWWLFWTYQNAKPFAVTRLIPQQIHISDFFIFKMADSDWLMKCRPLCWGMTRYDSALTKIIMNLFGWLDANLVIFEHLTLPRMATGGHLEFREDGNQTHAQLSVWLAPKMYMMNMFGYLKAGLLIFEDQNIANMAAGGHLEFQTHGHNVKLSV